MKKIIAANYKMMGSEASLTTLISALNHSQHTVIICPPFPYLSVLKPLLEKQQFFLGAQNLCEAEKGAFTGEVSAAMLSDIGVRYVIVGHSERRTLFHEDNDLVAKKFIHAIASGLIPILCVGETLAEREHGQTEAVIAAQLDAVFSDNQPPRQATPATPPLEGNYLRRQDHNSPPEEGCPKGGVVDPAHFLIAYEPVWAIGTGKSASVDIAEAVHRFIRDYFKKKSFATLPPILYGGSVNAKNAADFFASDLIDGALIGSASLDAEQFNTMLSLVIPAQG
jgi:triosephosphate isomerase